MNKDKDWEARFKERGPDWWWAFLLLALLMPLHFGPWYVTLAVFACFVGGLALIAMRKRR